MNWKGIPQEDDCGCCKKSVGSYGHCPIAVAGFPLPSSGFGQPPGGLGPFNWTTIYGGWFNYYGLVYSYKRESLAICPRPAPTDSWAVEYTRSIIGPVVNPDNGEQVRFGVVFDYINPSSFHYIWPKYESWGILQSTLTFVITRVSGGSHTDVWSTPEIYRRRANQNTPFRLNHSYGEVTAVFDYDDDSWRGSSGGGQGRGTVMMDVPLSLNGGRFAGLVVHNGRYDAPGPLDDPSNTPHLYNGPFRYFYYGRGESARVQCLRPVGPDWSNEAWDLWTGEDLYIDFGAGGLTNSDENPFCEDLSGTIVVAAAWEQYLSLIDGFTDCHMDPGSSISPNAQWDVNLRPYTKLSGFGGSFTKYWQAVIGRRPGFAPPPGHPASYSQCNRANAIYESGPVSSYAGSHTLTLKDSYIHNGWCGGSFPQTIQITV